MKQFEYEINALNPCVDCKDYGKKCNGIDGGECEKAQLFLSLKQDYFDCKKELEITREYISRNNLEWDLLSFATRKSV